MIHTTINKCKMNKIRFIIKPEHLIYLTFQQWIGDYPTKTKLNKLGNSKDTIISKY